MNKVKNVAAQGDVFFRKVTSLPEGVVETDDKVVAHSETGHNHVVSGPATVYNVPGNPLLSYLVARGPVQIEHHRTFDTHAPLELLYDEGEVIWEVRRQKEYTPEGWRRVED